MSGLRIGLLGAGVVAVAMISIGVLGALPGGGADASDADPQPPHAAQPQGAFNDSSFGCTLFGTVFNTVGLSLQEYACRYAGAEWECGTVGNVLTCTAGDMTSQCTRDTGTTASCSDSGGATHVCTATVTQRFYEGVMTCLNSSGGSGLDFEDCSVGTNSIMTCMTESGAFVCPITTLDCDLTGGAELLVWGDVDCNLALAARDLQALLRNILGQNPLSQTEPCPDVGVDVGVSPPTD
jgi:hypothetical protein